MPFFAHKDFFPTPLISPILPSYAKVQAVVMAIIDSPYPYPDNSDIDLVVLAYIDDLVLDA
jgi:hypothetical protein